MRVWGCIATAPIPSGGRGSRPRLFLLALLVVALGCASARSADPPPEEMTFQQAFAMTNRQMALDYEDVAREMIGERTLAATYACRLPKGEAVGVVVAIGANGRPVAVYVDPPTARNECLRSDLAKMKLPEPPFAPFFTTPSFDFLSKPHDGAAPRAPSSSLRRRE